MDFSQSLPSHHAKLGDHERRLGEHDKELKGQGDAIADLRVDVARFVAIAAVGVTLLTSVATAVIVRYLPPAKPVPTPASSLQLPGPHKR